MSDSKRVSCNRYMYIYICVFVPVCVIWNKYLVAFIKVSHIINLSFRSMVECLWSRWRPPIKFSCISLWIEDVERINTYACGIANWTAYGSGLKRSCVARRSRSIVSSNHIEARVYNALWFLAIEKSSISGVRRHGILCIRWFMHISDLYLERAWWWESNIFSRGLFSIHSRY